MYNNDALIFCSGRMMKRSGIWPHILPYILQKRRRQGTRRAASVQPVSFGTSAFPEFPHLQWDIPDRMPWDCTVWDSETPPPASLGQAPGMRGHPPWLPAPCL